MEKDCIVCGGKGYIKNIRDLLARSPNDEQKYQQQLNKSSMYKCCYCNETGKNNENG